MTLPFGLPECCLGSVKDGLIGRGLAFRGGVIVFTNVLMNAVAGGILIGLAASWLFLSLGRVAGISGIVSQAIKRPATIWPVMFVVGLGAGGWIAALFLAPDSTRLDIEPAWLVLGGLIVGFGTRLGAGCTSGHGVCGIARLSPRSIVATMIFVGLGMLTATLLRGVGVIAA